MDMTPTQPDIATAKADRAGGRAPRPARWASAEAAGDLRPLWRLLTERGAEETVLPGVTALRHALCCATLAQQAGASPELIAASLLHDVGHLLRTDFAVEGHYGGRDRHAMIGAAFLSLWFGPDVTEPVRLHAEAKRFLAATETGYAARLHLGARTSLARNGGAMSADEARAFLEGPRAREAILLRRWDDLAETAAIEPRALAHFKKIVHRCQA